MLRSNRSYVGYGAFLFIVTLLAFISANVDAAGFRLPNQSAFATARGNAFIATADDASAIYYNAAGLTQLSENELQLGIYLIDFDVDFERDGTSYTNENDIQAVPQLFYAHQFESFSAGIGIYAPFGLGNEWGDNTPFTSITTDASIEYITINPVIAYEISNSFSIGGGLTYNYASADIEQGIGFAPDERIRIEGSDSGFGWTLSALWNPSEKHYFGVSYRSGVTHALEGDAEVTLAGLDPSVTRMRFEIDIPDILGIGYSYRPNERWNIEFDLEYGDWSSLDTPVIENTPLGDLPNPFNWEDGLIYQIGATYYGDTYAYSFGYDLNESVQTEVDYNPAVADADRDWLNIGISKLSGKRPWSIAYQYGFSDREINESVNMFTTQTANGRFDTSVHTLSFSLGFRL